MFTGSTFYVSSMSLNVNLRNSLGIMPKYNLLYRRKKTKKNIHLLNTTARIRLAGGVTIVIYNSGKSSN